MRMFNVFNRLHFCIILHPMRVKTTTSLRDFVVIVDQEKVGRARARARANERPRERVRRVRARELVIEPGIVLQPWRVRVIEPGVVLQPWRLYVIERGIVLESWRVLVQVRAEARVVVAKKM